MDKKTVLSCKDIVKSFGYGHLKTEVLKKATIEIFEGDFIMLVGPSGSGKTTLLSIIATLLSFESGECSLLNQNIKHLNESEKTEIRKKKLGYVFQTFNLIPTLTVFENINIPLLINNIRGKEASDRIYKQLGRFGIESRKSAFPCELSSGEKQRVSIARALVHNPDFIICDEPTSSLDFENGQIILRYLKKIAEKESKTILIVTHDTRIFKFADQIFELSKGAIYKHNEN